MQRPSYGWVFHMMSLPFGSIPLTFVCYSTYTESYVFHSIWHFNRSVVWTSTKTQPLHLILPAWIWRCLSQSMLPPLSLTHFPCYFQKKDEAITSLGNNPGSCHPSILHIVIQVGTCALSVHEVHFQFTLYNYPACTYYYSLWILTRLIPSSLFPLLCLFSLCRLVWLCDWQGGSNWWANT